jgi:hypothetical protein
MGCCGLASSIDEIDVSAPDFQFVDEFARALIVHDTGSCGLQLNIGLEGIFLPPAPPNLPLLFLFPLVLVLVLDIYLALPSSVCTRFSVE